MSRKRGVESNTLSVYEEKLKELISEVYYAGQRHAATEMVNSLGLPASSVPVPSDRAQSWHSRVRAFKAPPSVERAPRGTSLTLVSRVLAAGPSSVRGIADKAKTPGEKKLSLTAIYLELQRGKKAKRYQNNDGLWSLIE